MDRIQNPTTGKWVNTNGAAGQRILGNYVKYNQNTIVRNPQSGGGTFNKIQNPTTGNWVNVNGPAGQKVLQNYVRQVGGENMSGAIASPMENLTASLNSVSNRPPRPIPNQVWNDTFKDELKNIILDAVKPLYGVTKEDPTGAGTLYSAVLAVSDDVKANPGAVMISKKSKWMIAVDYTCLGDIGLLDILEKTLTIEAAAQKSVAGAAAEKPPPIKIKEDLITYHIGKGMDSDVGYKATLGLSAKKTPMPGKIIIKYPAVDIGGLSNLEPHHLAGKEWMPRGGGPATCYTNSITDRFLKETKGGKAMRGPLNKALDGFSAAANIASIRKLAESAVSVLSSNLRGQGVELSNQLAKFLDTKNTIVPKFKVLKFPAEEVNIIVPAKILFNIFGSYDSGKWGDGLMTKPKDIEKYYAQVTIRNNNGESHMNWNINRNNIDFENKVVKIIN